MTVTLTNTVFTRPIVLIKLAIQKGAQVWGVVKGFQIACNLAGPLGDLTGTGDQSSGKVVLVIRCRTRQGDNQHGIRTTRGGHAGVFSSWSIGYRYNPSYIIGDKCKIGLAKPTVLRNVFSQAEPGNKFYCFLSRGLAPSV